MISYYYKINYCVKDVLQAQGNTKGNGGRFRNISFWNTVYICICSILMSICTNLLDNRLHPCRCTHVTEYISIRYNRYCLCDSHYRWLDTQNWISDLLGWIAHTRHLFEGKMKFKWNLTYNWIINLISTNTNYIIVNELKY